MCGIAGILGPDPSRINKQRLQAMTDTIIHRGPEGEGFWINEDNTCGFGHRRLCIIDLTEAAAQPMHYLQRYTIIYNGEIYNYLEIKQTLQQKGYHFSTQSDTEVILAAYAHYKESCLEYFDGMFAFVIWDSTEKKLFAARDRFGEKPFYFFQDELTKEFLFASEIKALWAAGIQRSVDDTMLLNYLTIGWTEDPTDRSRTFYNNIHSLAPAHYLIYTINQPVITKSYWALNKTSNEVNRQEAIEKFSVLFQTAVKRRMRSDVPVGTSLSGGLDSSSIVAAASRFASSNYSHNAFSAVFPGFEKDESAYIDAVTKKFGLHSFTVSPGVTDLLEDFDALLYFHDQPIGSASAYAQFKVYEAAKKHGVTVLLDGQGADEVLAGYTKYIHWFLQELLRKHSKKWKQEKTALEKNGIDFNWSIKNVIAAWLPSATAKQLEKNTLAAQIHHTGITKDFLSAHLDKSMLFKPTVHTLNDLLHFNLKSFGLPELLRYADTNSMAHGREVRLPFLQHELVECIFSLPSDFKIHEGWTKWILRKSMQNILPDEIVWRKDKVGYEPPQLHWMNNKVLQDRMHESKKKLAAAGILKADVVNKKIQPLDSTAADNFDWRYLVADNLLRRS